MNTARSNAPDAPRPSPQTAYLVPARRRSFCFLERDGDRWTVFLVTYPDETGRWRGYFEFRSATAVEDEETVRTAVLFVEPSEPEVDLRARGLGRPLLNALLESALEARERRKDQSAETQRWFRDLLVRHAEERLPDVGTPVEDLSLKHLRSLYDSYRLDQVAHLIVLIGADRFAELVEEVLDGRTIDFRARDRFQLAVLVVQDLERRLPLPPFEVWVEDYLAHPDAYREYSYALHRGDDPGAA